MANGINSSGQIVGGLGSSAFFLTNSGNTLTSIPSATFTTTAEVAFGINDKGTIVGQYTDSSTGTSPGFVYAKGIFTTLNPVSNDSQVFAQGINNNGLVVGFYSTDGVHDHGFLYNTITSSYTLLADPNVSNLLFTQFLGINDQNEAVGTTRQTTAASTGSSTISRQARTLSSTIRSPRPAACRSRRSRGSTTPGKSPASTSMRSTGLQRGFVASGSVPEPGSFVLLGVGVTLAASCAVRRGVAAVSSCLVFELGPVI